jgi:hypothetical protein
MIKIKSHHLLYESINDSDCPVCSLVYFGQCYETRTLVQSRRIVTSFWDWLSKTYGCTSMASGDSTRNLNLFCVLVCYSVKNLYCTVWVLDEEAVRCYPKG